MNTARSYTSTLRRARALIGKPKGLEEVHARPMNTKNNTTKPLNAQASVQLAEE